MADPVPKELRRSGQLTAAAVLLASALATLAIVLLHGPSSLGAHAPPGESAGATAAGALGGAHGAPSGTLVHSDAACNGVYLSANAHALAECLELAHAAGCAPYVSHSADFGFCFACTQPQVGGRVAQPGYAIYATGCDAADAGGVGTGAASAQPLSGPAAAAAAAVGAAPVSRAPSAPSAAVRLPAARSPPPPSPSPPPPSPSPPPPPSVALAPFSLAFAGFACGSGTDLVSASAGSAFECQRAVGKSGRDLSRTHHWAFSQQRGLCVACAEAAVRRRVPMAEFDIFEGVAFSPPSPPSPPPNWRPRPPPSPRPPPHPRPPSPPPPPVVSGVVRAGTICGGASSPFGLSGAALEQPHFQRVRTPEECARKMGRSEFDFFAHSASLGWCFGCTRHDLSARTRADTRYAIYQTAAYNPQGGGVNDDPLDAFHLGEGERTDPFLHLSHSHNRGALGLRDLFGLGGGGGGLGAEPAAAALPPVRGPRTPFSRVEGAGDAAAVLAAALGASAGALALAHAWRRRFAAAKS
ncbi:hypothetical protein KFE25_012545 [Diacronema lutheri]|uniref:Uncharacterized protein n=2 Tax=Diacronema lutheri TaxID=2081491 RepID=A0A8J5XNH6_DIALT|nr:hypothetical protein KFE25_012545 [Diacronema lutheri]